jgi:hypothetical protein
MISEEIITELRACLALLSDAMMYPEPESPGRGKKGFATIQFPMVSNDSLARARKVLRLAGDLVSNVPSNN